MKFQKILVPVDFSETSAAALRVGHDLADALGASLHVLHVLPDPITSPWTAPAFSKGVRGEMDLIVMGTHGRGGLSHALLGSVAE